MLDRLSQDSLTNSILNAIIRRTYITLAIFNDDEELPYYEGENFIWDLDNDHPTLKINIESKFLNVVYLWWNKEKDDEKIEVFSNISIDAKDDLNFFLQLEKLVYEELDKLELPPRLINLETPEDEKYLYE
jgi:hypothetical protein